MRRFFVALSLSILASACAQLPRAELSAYTAAFDATNAAAEPLLADFAVAERKELLLEMQGDAARHYRDNGFFDSFRPGDAAALSEASLPPRAASLDRAFRAIGRYNATLVALAENRNVEEARGQLGQLIDELGGIAPPVAKMPLLKPAANALVELLRPAVVMDNREQFRRIVLDAQPTVKGLIAALRDDTPNQYDTMTGVLQSQFNRAAPGPERDKIAEKISAWHSAYANYVAVLNALDRRVDELAEAVRHPKSQSLLQRAAAGAVELRSYTDALRLSLAALRAKP